MPSTTHPLFRLAPVHRHRHLTLDAQFRDTFQTRKPGKARMSWGHDQENEHPAGESKGDRPLLLVPEQVSDRQAEPVRPWIASISVLSKMGVTHDPNQATSSHNCRVRLIGRHMGWSRKGRGLDVFHIRPSIRLSSTTTWNTHGSIN